MALNHRHMSDDDDNKSKSCTLDFRFINIFIIFELFFVVSWLRRQYKTGLNIVRILIICCESRKRFS